MTNKLSKQLTIVFITVLVFVAIYWLSLPQATSTKVSNVDAKSADSMGVRNHDSTMLPNKSKQDMILSKAVAAIERNAAANESADLGGSYVAIDNLKRDENIHSQQSRKTIEKLMYEKQEKTTALSLAREDEKTFLIEKRQLIEKFVQLGGTLNGDKQLTILDTISDPVRLRLQEIIDTLDTQELQIKFARQRIQTYEKDLEHIEQQL
jgi:hypothetical protein